MTDTLTDLPTRVSDAIDDGECDIATFTALAADWQRLRERERVLTEALESAAGGLHGAALVLSLSGQHGSARALGEQYEAACAALSPETKPLPEAPR